MEKLGLILSSLIASTTFMCATVYDDAEDGNTNGWAVYDNNPAGATITNQFDSDKNSKVIVLSGEGAAGRNNGFRLGHWNSSESWNNSREKLMRWSMKFNDNFTLFISIKTTKGLRQLYYTPVDYDLGMSSNGRYIHHGLGSNADDGTWRRFTRDILADLREYEPKNRLLSVNAFLVRGYGKVDDIELRNGPDKRLLGKALFYDKSLSLTKNTSCATCHDPKNAFVDARFKTSPHPIHGALSIGDDGVALGGRNAPTAAYAMFSPAFHYDNDRAEYVGGQFHDGRAATLKDQAMGPPLDPAEMMMPNKTSVVDRIKENNRYVREFKRFFGDDIFNSNRNAYAAMGQLIGSYESTPREFAPFDSKYDRFLKCTSRGNSDESCYANGSWSRAEKAGMDIFFNNPAANCRNCHQINAGEPTADETFTNYAYYNIGTPRNQEALAAKGLPADYVDHGIYGRADISDASLDGAIKVPTLRNVAVTGPYMSNGVFKTLRATLEYYVHLANVDENGNSPRPNNPETGQPWGEPQIKETIREDLLALPALDDATLDALEAFLGTLTDRRYEHLLKK